MNTSVLKLKSEMRSQMRSQMRARLLSHTTERQVAQGDKISGRIKKITSRYPGVWFGFRSQSDEPSLPEVDGVQWAFPVVENSEKGEMQFFRWTESFDPHWQKNKWGIEEPDLSAQGWRKLEPTQATGLLIPGLAFDRQLRRLGRGGGYYDRYLKKVSRSTTKVVGVCFTEQLVEAVPHQAHDVALDGLLTESELVWAVTGVSAEVSDGESGQ